MWGSTAEVWGSGFRHFQSAFGSLCDPPETAETRNGVSVIYTRCGRRASPRAQFRAECLSRFADLRKARMPGIARDPSNTLCGRRNTGAPAHAAFASPRGAERPSPRGNLAWRQSRDGVPTMCPRHRRGPICVCVCSAV